MLPPLARDTTLMLLWQLARAMLQGTWGIVLARVLEPQGYGLFAGFAGLATILGAVTGAGFGLLMLQKASRDPLQFSNYWTTALIAAGGSAALLLVFYVGVAPAITGQAIGLTLLIGIAVPELVCLPVVVVCSYAFQAHDRMGWGGAMYALMPAGNMSALALFLATTEQRSLTSYLYWHTCTAVGATALSLIVVYTLLRPERRWPALMAGDSGNAFSYTAMRLVDTGLASLDKTLVLRLAGSEAAGQYTAAYRLASLIALPIISLAVSITPRLFRVAAYVRSDRIDLTRSLLKWGIVIGLVTVPATWGFSHVLPWLFGEAYKPAGALARHLSVLPGLLGLSALGCSILMTRNGRVVRTMIQAGAIVALLLLMPWLIGAHKANGAVWAIQLIYAGLALAVWWVILRADGGRSELRLQA